MLDLELRHVPVPAVDLERIEVNTDARLRHEGLGHGCFRHGLPALVHQPPHPKDQRPGRVHGDLHVGDLIGHGFELGDRFAELSALPRVADAGFHGSAHESDLAGHDARPLPSHRRVEDLTALPGLTEHGRVRHEQIIQEDLGHGRGPKPELLQRFPHAQARRCALHEKGADPERPDPFPLPREHDEQIRHGGIGDEGLATVDDVAALDPCRGTPHGERVRARFRFGDGVASDGASRAQPGQPPRLLLGRPERPDGDLAGPHVRVDGEDQPVVAVAVTERLQAQHRGNDVLAAPAELFRDRHAQDAEGRAPVPGVPRELFGPFALADIVRQRPGEPADGVIELSLLRGQPLDDRRARRPQPT